ncbi:MAG: ankyrin repeat domain-containing protein [Candidatus Micrarchaeaceae archaeon]
MSTTPEPFAISGINFEILKYLNYKELINFCSANRTIKQICDTDPNIANLKIQKYVQYIIEKNDNDLSKTFFKSIETNNIIVLNYLINNMNFDPSVNDNQALIFACQLSNYVIVNILTNDKRVDILAQNYEALYTCVENGDLNIFDLFLNKTDIPKDVLDELFMVACMNQKISIVNRLLTFNIDINVLNDALINACENGYTDIFDILINIPDVDPSVNNNVCLEQVSLNGNLDIFYKLISDKRVSVSDNMFINACSNGHYEIAKTLLNYNINPASNDQQALISASKNGHIDVVKLLLSLPEIDPSKQDQSALNMASIYGHYDVVKILLSDKRINPVYQNCIALLYACQYGHKNIVELFVLENLVSDKQCFNNCLTTALRSKKYNIVDLLVDKVDVESLNEGIKISCLNGSYETTELLMSYGADPSVDNNFCIICASEYRYTNIVYLLLKDSRVDPSDKNYSALKHAILNNDYNTIDMLISDKRIKEIPESIVDIVIKNGNLDILNLLIRKKLQVTERLLYKAVIFHKSLIVKRLLDFEFTENQINKAIKLVHGNDEILLSLYNYISANFGR